MPHVAFFLNFLGVPEAFCTSRNVPKVSHALGHLSRPHTCEGTIAPAVPCHTAVILVRLDVAHGPTFTSGPQRWPRCWTSNRPPVTRVSQRPNSRTAGAQQKSPSAGKASPRCSQYQNGESLNGPLISAFRDLVPRLSWGTRDFINSPRLASPEKSKLHQRMQKPGVRGVGSRQRMGSLERRRYISFNKG